MSEYNRNRSRQGTGRRMTPEERRRREEKRRLAEKKKKEARLIRILTIVVAVLLVAVIVIVVVSCSGKKKTEQPAGSSAVVPEVTTEEEVTEPPRSEVELVSVGDVLIHNPLLNYADQVDGVYDDGVYDFNEIFSVMKDDISRADIAICNQETPVDTTQPADGGAAFIFNTPGAIGDAEINAGFDVVLQSSNHSYDMGSDGILHTIDFWKTKEGQITMIGMNESQEKRDTVTYYEKNGIKFALLNYTYGLNGFELPYDMDYLVTVIDDNHREMIENDIRTADANADFVIVFPHWGVEDLWPDTTEFQDQWAQIFTDAGADLIIGTHPHVCERIDWLTAADGHKCLCYYSLGNYASNQQEAPEVLGGMAKVKIVKENGSTYIDESATGVVPIVTHNVFISYDNVSNGQATNRVVCYKLSDYTEEMAMQHDIVTNYREDGFSLARLQEIANTTFGDWIISY